MQTHDPASYTGFWHCKLDVTYL